MAIHQGIRILDIISEVTISPDLKTTHYAKEEPLYHYTASSNVCIYASEHLSEGETKFPKPLTQSFSLKSFTNFGITPTQYIVHSLRNSFNRNYNKLIFGTQL